MIVVAVVCVTFVVLVVGLCVLAIIREHQVDRAASDLSLRTGIPYGNARLLIEIGLREYDDKRARS